MTPALAVNLRVERSVMQRAQSSLILMQRNVILALLLLLAAAAWAVLAWQASVSDMAMPTTSPTMGMRAPLFLLIWVVMMVAMMFPTAAPMILTFHRVQAGKRQRGEAFVATWVFVAGYMLVWTLSGIIAYVGALAAEPLVPLFRQPPRQGSAGRYCAQPASINSRRSRTCACRSVVRRSASS